MKIIKFSIAALDIDDDQLRRRYDEIGMDAIAKLRNAQADKGVMDVLGNDWGRQQAANILGTLAENPGSGGVASAGAGVGMGMAAGNVFAGMAQQMFIPIQPQTSAQSVVPQTSSRFTQRPESSSLSSGETGSGEDPVATLKKLKEMLDLGLIEQAEYDAKKTEIMSRM